MTNRKKIFMTGAAGFIGSHLADGLITRGYELVGLDNLSAGNKEFLKNILDNDSFRFVKADILRNDFAKHMQGCDSVFHLAANPEVRIGAQDTRVHLDQNIVATYRVLEAMKKTKIKDIIFTSTSTVYGEAILIPTPENYGPLMPISLYGSSKLACEAMISAYCHTFEMTATMYRFANVVGERSTHGVVYDFVQKLKKDPKKLEILGREPGTRKSYCHVKDCVEAMLFGWQNRKEQVEAFNIGSEDHIDVKTIANAVRQELGLEDVEFQWQGKKDERGWIGDVKVMLLAIDKIKTRGWTPKYGSEGSVRLAAREIAKSS
jgi:UDP-glucose 4-epimerase